MGAARISDRLDEFSYLVSTMSDNVRRTQIESISREQINELLRQQERELPLRGQMQPAADADESERALRRKWRQQRQAARRQEHRQEPERWCGEDWNVWCDQRIAIALA